MSGASTVIRSAASTLTHRPPITAASFRPAFVDGRWHKPAISAMQRATLRRRAAQLSDDERAAIPDRASLRPALPVKFKGHKAERSAPAKAKKIEQAMKDMPKKVEEYYRLQRSLRKHDTQLTRILDEDEINAGKSKKGKSKPAAGS